MVAHFIPSQSINKISNIFRLKIVRAECDRWKINKRQNEIFNKAKYVLSLDRSHSFSYWVNLLWINYADWRDVCWTTAKKGFLALSLSPVLRAAETYPAQELWHDVSLLKLLLHCFSPHVPYRRWQLTVLFVLFSYHTTSLRKKEKWNWNS